MSELERRVFLKRITSAAGVSYLLGPGSNLRMLLAKGVGRRGTEDKGYWRIVREAFDLDDRITYVNNGTLGPTPRVVRAAVERAHRRLAHNPAEVGYGELINEAEVVRKESAHFIGAEEDELAVTASTTQGMNWVAAGLWHSGYLRKAEIVTTNHEHPGGLAGWRFLEHTAGLTVRQVNLPVPLRSGRDAIDLIDKAITAKTKVLMFSHVTYSTGTVLPAAELCRLARDRGVFAVVDGAQAVGAIPVDVKKIGCDAYVSSSHKWLLAPQGTGLLYVRGESQPHVRPAALADGFSIYTASTGTRNLPAMIGHGAALAFHRLIGSERVFRRIAELRNRLTNGLQALGRYELASPNEEALLAGLVTIRVDADPGRLKNRLLQEHGVVARAVVQSGTKGLRFSTHVYNSEEEIDRVVAAVKAL